MNEEKDGQQPGDGAEAIAEAPKVETALADTSEATAEQSEATTEDDAHADDAGEKPKRKAWWQERIDDITAKRYEAERTAAYWRGQAEGRQPIQPQAPEQAGPPTLEQYDYDEGAFANATQQWAIGQAERVVDRKLSEREYRAQAQETERTVVARLQEAATKHADFAEVVGIIPTTEAVIDFIASDPNAGDVFYALGKDPAAVRKFLSLPPYRQAVELGRLSATHGAPKTNPRNPPPPPPNTVTGIASGLNKKPEDMSFDEFKKWREAPE